MTGYYAPYVPGWDTHGLPIETAIQKQGRQAQRACPLPEFRDKCRSFALELRRQVSGSSSSAWGCIGDWEHPYLTLKPEFEAKQIEVFGAMAEKGYIYKGLKPVYWCPTCQTALAEAEIEYADDPVHHHVTSSSRSTTTRASWHSTAIWTRCTSSSGRPPPGPCPGNMAICLNPQLEYCSGQDQWRDLSSWPPIWSTAS